MIKKKQLLAGFIGATVLSACVPAKKYEELEAKYKSCDEELAKYKDDSESAIKKLKDLEVEHEKLKDETEQLRRDNKLKEDSYNNLTTRYDKLNEVNQTLLDQIERLQKMAENQNANLTTELKLKQLELQQKEDELRKLEAELKETEARLKLLEADLNKQKDELAEKSARVDELEELLRKKDETVNALKDKVAAALLGFKDKGLTVEERNGKVYVKMEAKLLFASGSTKVGAEGKDALVKLAKVLEEQKDMEVVVEGHTDTDKLKSPNHPKNNWELSVLRSTSVVEIMLANSSMDPKILSASGRSEFLPVSDDKSKNRRIEIILTPNLDELYRIINNE